MNDLLIFGAGGFGREVAWLVERINNVNPTWNLVGFIDDNQNVWGAEIDGYKVIGGSEKALDFKDCYFICAVGASKVRKKIINKLKSINKDIKFATLIDPSVLISKRVTIGEGSIICAGNIITVDINIENHVIINLNCTIGHDSVMSNYVTVYPNVSVSGNTFLEECVELGTGSVIIQNKHIGEETIVGAGAIVIRDLPKYCTAVGSPAKAIKFHK